MQGRLILILVFAQAMLSGAQAAELATLAELRWTHRIILVDGAGTDELAQLRSGAPDIIERDLIWFCVTDGQIQSNYAGALDADFHTQLRERYFDTTGSRVLLIGKDGGIKSRDSTLDLPRYLDLIDSMPMRQAEAAASHTD